MIRTLIFGLFVLLVSCNESDSTSCLDKKTITTINNPGDEFETQGYKEAYSDANYKIYVSLYLSPNGDAVRDDFGFFIVKNDDTAYCNYSGIKADHLENLQISNEPTGFFSEGSLRISNNCDSLFFNENINQLNWAPSYTANTPEGTYKVNLKLKLDDNTLVDINTTTEVLKTYFPEN